MDEIENAFPMDFYARDPSPRPWKFRPEGYLVVILSDADEAQRAEASLVSHGFVPRDVKLYTGKQILENYEVYCVGEMSRTRWSALSWTTRMARSSTSPTRVKIAVRCGCVSRMKRMSRKPYGSSPTTTTFTRATTAPSDRPTSTFLTRRRLYRASRSGVARARRGCYETGLLPRRGPARASSPKALSRPA